MRPLSDSGQDVVYGCVTWQGDDGAGMSTDVGQFCGLQLIDMFVAQEYGRQVVPYHCLCNG